MISEKGIQILLSCKNIIAFEPDDLYKSLAEQAKLNREAHGIPSGIPIREQIEMAYAMCRRNP